MKNICLFCYLIYLFISFPVYAQTLEERISQLENKMEEIDIDRSFQRVHFSGTFISYAEVLDSRTQDQVTDEVTRSNGLLSSIHVGLNIDFKISSNIDFFTTLAMGKILNNDGREGYAENSYHSNQGSYGYTGSEAKFDVAYLRWKTTDSLSFALGRMTTRGGPPLNQLDALYRSGTYPRFGYNAIFDGAALVYDFKDFMPQNMSFKTRIFYTPYFYVDSNDRTSAQTDPDGNEVERRSDQVAWLNEWELNKTSFARNISIYSMVWYYDKFYDAEYQTNTTDGPDEYSALSHTLYVGFEHIMDTALNFSWSYLRVKDKLTGEESDNSDSSLFNINYTNEKGWVFGLEHIATDVSFYLDEYAYLQFNDFYQRSNNNGQHYFFTIPFPHNQVLRFGLYSYRAGVSEPNNYLYKERTQNFYASYRIDF